MQNITIKVSDIARFSLMVSVVLIPAVSSCSVGNLDHAAHLIMVQKNEELYRARAIQFVRWAQNGQVESMLLYTSRHTIETSGSSQLRNLYAHEVVPKFKGTEVRWTRNSAMITDEHGNAGIRFSGRTTGNPSLQFHIDIFGEDGELVIINITRG